MGLKSEKISAFLSKKKNITLVYVIVIIGVLLLSFGSLTPQRDGAKAQSTPAQPGTELEERIASVLSEIKGVGKARVLITYKSTGSLVTAKDVRSSGGGEDSSYDREEKNVLTGSGSAQKPFVIKEEMPKILGVIVVAEGGGDSKAKLEITEAVKAITGVSANNIGVFAGK